MSILEIIKRNEDILALNNEQRKTLCDEIRHFLVSHVSKTGGHLASNLGVVELTVAIETVFNTEKDRLVFDVGHQSYVHKLLTGRQADFDYLRSFGGIAGFPKPSESVTDAFVAGHASSSVSIALGMARARSLLGEDYHVVALVGDGAATGGMIYEAMNDAAESREPMVIILNDNEMSIQKNVGGLSRHLARVRTKSKYLGAKEKYRTFLHKIPGGKGIYRFTRKIKDLARRLLLPTTIFENMGLTYFGPVDGHDLPQLIEVLNNAKELGKPVVVHVLTQKGKGYLPAEEQPAQFHGVGRFDPDSGEVKKTDALTFSAVFGKTLCSLAEEDSRICAITAAMPGGTGLLEFKEKFPERLFDVGIAEEHAVSMAGGLAKQGMIPVVALYSTFLQRAYDMLMQDVALLGLPVIFAVDRAGLVGEDGETHHGVFDVGFLRQVPQMRILSSACIEELQQMLRWAAKENQGPVAIRYPRGGDRGCIEPAWPNPVCLHRKGDRCALISYGTLTAQALAAADLLEEDGIRVSVIRLLSIAPLPVKELAVLLHGVDSAVIMEEACTGSGIKEPLLWELRKLVPGCKFYGLDLGGKFVTHGALDALYRHCGLDPESVKNFVSEVISDEN